MSVIKSDMSTHVQDQRSVDQIWKNFCMSAYNMIGPMSLSVTFIVGAIKFINVGSIIRIVTCFIILQHNLWLLCAEKMFIRLAAMRSENYMKDCKRQAKPEVAFS